MENSEESLFFANDGVPDDEEDEIDRLFSRLQSIKPPPALIAQILAQTRAQDPLASALSEPPLTLEELDDEFMPGRKGKFRAFYS